MHTHLKILIKIDKGYFMCKPRGEKLFSLFGAKPCFLNCVNSFSYFFFQFFFLIFFFREFHFIIIQVNLSSTQFTLKFHILQCEIFVLSYWSILWIVIDMPYFIVYVYFWFINLAWSKGCDIAFFNLLLFFCWYNILVFLLFIFFVFERKRN